MQTIIDGISTFGQLQQIATGTFNYTQSNVPLTASSTGLQAGTYSLGVNVDFGARLIGTTGSYLTINSPPVSGNVIPSPISFADAAPNDRAVGLFQSRNGTGQLVGSACGASQTCEADLGLAALNASGKTAASLVHVLSVLTDQGAEVLAGFGIADQQPGVVTNPNSVPSGTSSFDQLRSINSGQFFYSQANVPLSLGGQYNIAANIDFGARTFGGGNSKVDVSGTPTLANGTVLIPSMNWAASPGNALFQYNNLTGIPAGPSCGGGCLTDVTITPQNANNTVALRANQAVSISNSRGTLLHAGSGTMSRQGGLAP